MTATITRNNWGGTYIARLELNDRGTFDREWGTVSKIVKGKSGGSVRYYSDLQPGWYESREGYRIYKGQPTAKTYHRVDALTVTVIDFETLVAALSGPLPGEHGEWGTDTCHCGAEVSEFDSDGYPKCAEHTVSVEAVEGLPVPV